MEKISKMKPEEVVKLNEYEGFVEGIPNGMYADRASYGNAPILAFVLDRKLICKARARPYSHRNAIRESSSPRESLAERLFDFESDNENENLAIAAALMNQAIREQSSIEIEGHYKNGIFDTKFLRIGNIGFEFPGYRFPYEREEEL